MRFFASTDQTNANDIAFLDSQRLRVGKRLAIDGEVIRLVAGKAAVPRLVGPAGDPAGKHHDVILGDFLFDWRRIFWINDQRAPHTAHRDMLVDVDMAVIPHRSRRLGLEAIRECFTRRDGGLRGVRNTIILPATALKHAVPVNSVRQCRIVFDLNLEIVAFRHMKQGAGHLTVEREDMEGLLVDQRDDRIVNRHREMTGLG